MNQKNYVLFIGAIVLTLFGSILSLFFVFREIKEVVNYYNDGVVVGGEILEIGEKTDESYRELTIRYSFREETLSAKIYTKDGSLEAGNIIQVILLPSDPKTLVINTFKGKYSNIIISLILFLFFLSGFLLIIKYRDWLLRQEGGVWPYG
ncbi:hypothetical protein [Marivirga lumbricoides]